MQKQENKEESMKSSNVPGGCEDEVPDTCQEPETFPANTLESFCFEIVNVPDDIEETCTLEEEEHKQGERNENSESSEEASTKWKEERIQNSENEDDSSENTKNTEEELAKEETKVEESIQGVSNPVIGQSSTADDGGTNIIDKRTPAGEINDDSADVAEKEDNTGKEESVVNNPVNSTEDDKADSESDEMTQDSGNKDENTKSAMIDDTEESKEEAANESDDESIIGFGATDNISAHLNDTKNTLKSTSLDSECEGNQAHGNDSESISLKLTLDSETGQEVSEITEDNDNTNSSMAAENTDKVTEKEDSKEHHDNLKSTIPDDNAEIVSNRQKKVDTHAQDNQCTESTQASVEKRDPASNVINKNVPEDISESENSYPCPGNEDSEGGKENIQLEEDSNALTNSTTEMNPNKEDEQIDSYDESVIDDDLYLSFEDTANSSDAPNSEPSTTTLNNEHVDANKHEESNGEFTPTIEENALSLQPTLDENTQSASLETDKSKLNEASESQLGENDKPIVMILQPKLVRGANSEASPVWEASLEFTPTQELENNEEINNQGSEVVNDGENFNFGAPDDSQDETLAPTTTDFSTANTPSSTTQLDARVKSLVNLKEIPKLSDPALDEDSINFNEIPTLSDPELEDDSQDSAAPQSLSILNDIPMDNNGKQTGAFATSSDEVPKEQIEEENQDESRPLPPSNFLVPDSDALSVISATTADTRAASQQASNNRPVSALPEQMGQGAFSPWERKK